MRARYGQETSRATTTQQWACITSATDTGGVELNRVFQLNGAVQCPLTYGHIPARQLYEQMRAYIAGIEEERARHHQSTTNNPWWWPKLFDADHAAALRGSFPEHRDLTDEELNTVFNDGRKYAVGDCYAEYELLANYILWNTDENAKP